MKIQQIKINFVRLPLEEPLVGAPPMPGMLREFFTVQVLTDDGIEGSVCRCHWSPPVGWRWTCTGNGYWATMWSANDEDEKNPRDPDGQRLLRKMLAAGVSRYDPDPLKALAGAKRRSSR
jgi:hypothetical protein